MSDLGNTTPEMPRFNRQEVGKRFMEWDLSSPAIIRSEKDSDRLFQVSEGTDGSVIREYYAFDIQKADFELLASAGFRKGEDGKFVPYMAKKVGSKNESIFIQFHGWLGATFKGLAWNPRPEFMVEIVLPQNPNQPEEKFRVTYSEEGVINYLSFGVGSNNLFSQVGMGIVIDKLKSDGIEKRMGGKSYKALVERDQTTDEDFVIFQSNDESVRARIPTHIPTDIDEKLFSREIFGDDPYTVHPSDDKWLQADWQTALGGFHWEHAVPKVSGEDTNLPPTEFT